MHLHLQQVHTYITLPQHVHLAFPLTARSYLFTSPLTLGSSYTSIYSAFIPI